MRILHISDLHISGDPRDNREVNTLLGHIWADFQPTDYLMVTGDITADGDESELAQAFRALSRFRGRLLLVPGNHDYANFGNDYGEERALRFESHLLRPLGIQHTFMRKDPEIQVLRDGDTRVLTIGLNSNRMNPGMDGFARGVLTDTQIRAVDQALADPASAGTFRVVYLHHQLKVGGDPIDLLEDAKQLLEVVRNRVHIAAFGHTCGGPIPNYPAGPGDDALTGPHGGAPYLLNANQSVLRRQYFLMTFEGTPRPGEYPSIVLRQPR